MKQLWAAIIYIVAVVLLGALIAPWLYWAGSWLTQAGLLKAYPFHRYFNRAVMLAAFAGLWPLVRALGIRRWADVGLVRTGNGWKQFGAGFVAGVASIAALAAGALLFGAQELKDEQFGWRIWGIVAAALATGLVVGVIEEIFFRGVVYGGLRRSVSFVAALAWTSLFYSVVHFLKPQPVPTGFVVHWWSGFEVPLAVGTRLVSEVLETIGQLNFGPATMWPYFTTLVLAGLALGWAFEKTGALHLPIGLHAGWVFALQLNPRLFASDGSAALWFGGGRLENGWLCAPLLAAMFAVAAWRLSFWFAGEKQGARVPRG